MYLYHGSYADFDIPNPFKGKYYRDFGVGFYLAENENDALGISVKHGDGKLYTYELDVDALFSSCNVLEFYDYNEEDFLKFIFHNRKYGGVDNQEYDVIIGPTAGGNINALFDEIRKRDLSYQKSRNNIYREASNTSMGIQWCMTGNLPVGFLELVEVEDVYR